MYKECRIMKLCNMFIVSKKLFEKTLKDKSPNGYGNFIEMTEKEQAILESNMKDSTLFVPVVPGDKFRKEDEEDVFIVLPDNESDIFGYLNLAFHNMNKYMEEYNEQTDSIDVQFEVDKGNGSYISLLQPLFKLYFPNNVFYFRVLPVSENI